MVGSQSHSGMTMGGLLSSSEQLVAMIMAVSMRSSLYSFISLSYMEL